MHPLRDVSNLREGLMMLRLISAAFLTWVITLSASFAEPAWPERPLRIVVPFPPGGVTDGIARQSAD